MTFISRMTSQNRLSEHLFVNFSINFCRRNLFVSKHHLDRSEVGSALQQMSGESMAEGMRTDLFAYPGFCTIALHYVEHHNAAQFTTKAIEEDIIFEAVFDINLISECIVIMNLSQSRLGNWHYALFATFAKY